MRFKLLLLIIPSIVIVNTFFTTSFSFWENRADPEYAYLFNGLNLANEYGNVGHFDHPGTTSQVFNAFVIKFSYILSNSKDNNSKSDFNEGYFFANFLNLFLKVGIVSML